MMAITTSSSISVKPRFFNETRLMFHSFVTMGNPVSS
jgi:hypothetical protein